MSENDEKIQEFLNNLGNILAKLEDLGIKQFNKRIAGLENHIETFTKHTIRSGLVGITSSGKSSLMNVLLGRGEKILKEQSKATTNMIVLCSKAETPQLEIHFDNGEVTEKSGKEILKESIWKYTSEDENPNNQFNVKYLKLKVPTFLLEGDIELADTPGLDAYGHQEHEDLTLREFLPQADLIMYLASIRSPMKEADRKILDKIMDADQRIVFVQTCKGAVVEQSYGEESSDTVADLLEKHRQEFKDSIKPYEKLKNAPIVQVETTQAIKYFKNNDINAWKESGLDEFVYVVKSVTGQLQEDFTIRNLRRTVNETNALNKLIISTIESDSDRERDIEDQKVFMHEVKTHYDKIAKDKDEIISKWKEKLDAQKAYFKYEHELSKIFGYSYDYNPKHDKQFMDKVHVIGEQTKKNKNEFLTVLDNAKTRYRMIFDKLGLDVRRADLQNVTQTTFFLPNVQKKQVADAVESGERESRSSLWSKKDITAEYIDKKKYMNELKMSLKYFYEPLTKHLEWWNQTVSFSYVDPLEKKIAALKDDMANMKTGGSYNDAQYRQLSNISTELSSLVQEVSPLCNIEPLKKKITPYKKYSGRTITIERRTNDRSLLLQLCNRLYEGMFHTYYAKCLSRISESKQKNIVLIAQEYESQINFLRRLMRLNNEAFGVLEELEPPYAINLKEKNGGIDNINIKGEFHDSFGFYVLGNDMNSLNSSKSEDMFEKADVIQVMIEDLHRVASAVTDLKERNLFFEFINQYRSKLLMTYPRAAYFQGERLHILTDEAILEINDIFESERLEWFIYENFEIRFNIFHDLATKMQEQKLNVDDCLKEWKSYGIPLDGAFTEENLRDQFAELPWA